jgi:hypothetical protein
LQTLIRVVIIIIATLSRASEVINPTRTTHEDTHSTHAFFYSIQTSPAPPVVYTGDSN